MTLSLLLILSLLLLLYPHRGADGGLYAVEWHCGVLRVRIRAARCLGTKGGHRSPRGGKSHHLRFQLDKQSVHMLIGFILFIVVDGRTAEASATKLAEIAAENHTKGPPSTTASCLRVSHVRLLYNSFHVGIS